MTETAETCSSMVEHCQKAETKVRFLPGRLVQFYRIFNDNQRFCKIALNNCEIWGSCRVGELRGAVNTIPTDE